MISEKQGTRAFFATTTIEETQPLAIATSAAEDDIELLAASPKHDDDELEKAIALGAVLPPTEDEEERDKASHIIKIPMRCHMLTI